MAVAWRESMESPDVNAENGSDEEVDEEIPTLLEHEESRRSELPVIEAVVDGKFSLELDEEIVKKISKLDDKIEKADSLGSYEEFLDVIEESDDGAETIEKIESEEEYEVDARVNRKKFFHEQVEEPEDEDEGEEEEEEEELYFTESSSTEREKLDDDVSEETESLDSDDADIDVLADIPIEILRDRQALIEKLRELRKDEPDLRRKNRLLQFWVARVMSKKHQTMTLENETLSSRGKANRYVKKLFSYKTTIDEIEARHGEIRLELDNLENNLTLILQEDSVTFAQLLDRESEIGVGLMLKKSGRVFNAGAIGAMIRKQVFHRDLLNRDRFKYIFLCHRYEDLKTKIRLAETLGEGLTIVDYELLNVQNEFNKDKLDGRQRDVEKLNTRVQTFVKHFANLKEINIATLTDMHHEKNRLKIIRSKTLRIRADISHFFQHLARIRNACVNKKYQGGLLFAMPVMREMEKTMKILDDLKVDVERMILKESTKTARTKLKIDENRTSVTRMTKVKSEGTRKIRPGRC